MFVLGHSHKEDQVDPQGKSRISVSDGACQFILQRKLNNAVITVVSVAWNLS